jgi:hypothetical protein
MIFAILFFSELAILFILSKEVQRKLSTFFYQITRSTKATIYLMALLFFPGTIIHELAHFIMAGILFVPVHHIEFIPKLEGDYVKLGSVTMARRDPFRRFFVGIAPIIVGVSLMLGIIFYTLQNNLYTQWWIFLFIAYIVFEIGNTMFSSKKDMEGALELLIAVGFLSLVFFLLGLRIPLHPEQIFTPIVNDVFSKGCLFLLIPLGIDLLCLGLFHLFKRKHHPHHHVQ